MTTTDDRHASPTRAEPARLGGLPPYPLADVPDLKARMRTEGHRIFDVGVGDSGLPVPGEAVEALREAALDPALQGYGMQRGLPAYREAVAAWMEKRFGASVDPDREILPVIGSKEAIALAAFAFLDAGDTALVPDPGYAPYFGGAYFAGARIERVPLTTGNGFLVPPARVLEAPGRLRLVYLNYPNNPTAAAPGPEYVRDIVDACARRGAVLLWDNAYSEIGFDGYRAPGLFEAESGREVGVELHSFSKSFNMTGWRLGWAAGAPRLIAALRRVKTFFDSGGYLAIQAAGAAVLKAPDAFLAWNVERLRERRDAAVPALRSAGLDVAAPRATLYLWMPIPTRESSEVFCRRMLLDAGVVFLPGSAMGPGGEGFARASLTLDPDAWPELAEAVRARL